MAKPRSPQPLYKVWCLDDAEDEAREYGALDVERAAQLHADWCHSRRDGWEWTWPVAFKVWDPETREHYVVVVEREMVPEFVPGKKLPAKMAPASHVIFGARSAMCNDPRLSGSWPVGQTSIAVDDWSDTSTAQQKLLAGSCAECRRRGDRHIQFMADVAVRKARIDADRAG